MPETKTIGQVVGENLKRIRKELHDQTQQEAARFLSLHGTPRSRDYIASLESGRRETLAVEELFTLSWAYMVPLSEWFQGADRVQLQDGPSLPVDLVRDWLASTNRADAASASHVIARAVVASLHDEEGGEVESGAEQKISVGLTDVELSARLDIPPRDVAKAARAVWGRRTSRELGHRTKRLLKDFEAHKEIEARPLSSKERAGIERMTRTAVVRAMVDELAVYLDKQLSARRPTVHVGEFSVDKGKEEEFFRSLIAEGRSATRWRVLKAVHDALQHAEVVTDESGEEGHRISVEVQPTETGGVTISFDPSPWEDVNATGVEGSPAGLSGADEDLVDEESN